MQKKRIIIIDETLREGMQYRGMMFSLEERKVILGFQEVLGVDICQAGYPPAHVNEAETVKTLFEYAKSKGFRIRVAGMGRATLKDARILLDTGIQDFHFHLHIKADAGSEKRQSILSYFQEVLDCVRQHSPDAVVSLALLDIGKSRSEVLDESVSFLAGHGPDIISLPDTSGMMAPNQVFDAISRLSALAADMDISVHCHNDLGLASANSIMGILAGSRVLEASALGIGERNGIADIYSAARVLKDQGLEMALNTENLSMFREYYKYMDDLVFKQTGEHLMNINTPVFGDAVKTHTPGTHAGGEFGLAPDADYDLNVLCGRSLLEKYLHLHGIACPAELLTSLTQAVKAQSIRLNRSLTVKDVQSLLLSLSKIKSFTEL
jgi:isopropylmalate/homocitrate/citramalate synthase